MCHWERLWWRVHPFFPLNPTFIWLGSFHFWLCLVDHQAAWYRLLPSAMPSECLFSQSQLTSAVSLTADSINLCAFNHCFIFWVTSSGSHLWRMGGWIPKGQQMCRWFVMGLWVSVCQIGVCLKNIPNHHLIIRESCNSREREGERVLAGHSCSDRVYLCGQRCWEEGEQTPLCTC